MSLIAELKRRHVIRMAGLYLVGAWLITQVASTVLPMFGAPEWLPRSVVILLAIGFVPTLIFSWIYELTPEGLRREVDVSGRPSMAQRTGRRIDLAIIAVLLVALAFFAVDRFVFEPRRATQLRVDDKPTQHEARAGRSIVVLPFADMSQAKDQEYLSDGLAEELLNLLARVPQLRVISRSSAFSFKGRTADVATIAKQLDVAHVLEGSVRKAGNEVRITVQLIDARSDEHIWSQTYDRPLDNIFAIQDEIAAEVVSKLKITLLGAAPKSMVTDPEAYALYLKAREQYRIGSIDAYKQAIQMFQQAITISPSYAEAWEKLGGLYLNAVSRGMRDTEEGITRAREASNRALAISPDMALAEANLGWISNGYEHDMAAAVKHTERALALDPGSVDVLASAGHAARSLGRLELWQSIEKRITELDPANPGPWGQLGKAYAFSGNDEEAIASYRTLIALSPAFGGARHWLSLVLLKQHKAEEALALAADEPIEGYRLVTLAMANFAMGRRAESDAALSQLTQSYERDSSYNIGYVRAFRGEPDLAFAALEKAVEYSDSGLTEVNIEPSFAPLYSDPRWLPFLREIRRGPEQLAAIQFHVTLPQ
jgi:TolB-like protein/Flp pilus assembly protein TadD